MVEKLPRHVAIIMDGNGRWARKRLKNRIFGHKQGIRVVKEVIGYCAKRGIKHLTLFTFSSENWRRPELEVNELMKLLKKYLKKEEPWLIEIGARLHMIGDRSKLPPDVSKVVSQVEESTRSCRKMALNLALSYGGKDEIIRAVRKMIGAVQERGVKEDAVDERMFEQFLDTAGQPDPDLLIRTSGEFRISNFLLWQLAYSEFYFTETLWPDFTVEELEAAFQSYMKRERRFGTV